VMDVFFGFVLLVLAGAVVLLFAMLGELTARLPTLRVPYRDPSVRPLEEARLGRVPSTWPASISSYSSSPRAPATTDSPHLTAGVERPGPIP
jgi:hypothetical protein